MSRDIIEFVELIYDNSSEYWLYIPSILVRTGLRVNYSKHVTSIEAWVGDEILESTP